MAEEETDEEEEEGEEEVGAGGGLCTSAAAVGGVCWVSPASPFASPPAPASLLRDFLVSGAGVESRLAAAVVDAVGAAALLRCFLVSARVHLGHSHCSSSAGRRSRGG